MAAKPKPKAPLRLVSREEPALAAKPAERTETGDRKALSLRLDPDQWLRLRQAALIDGRSVNAILVELIDQWLDPTRS